MKQIKVLSVKNLLGVYLPALLIALLFVTPFIVSDQLYNGVIVAKEFWFFGVVAAMLLYWAVSVLVKKGSITISLTVTDILLLAFYAWCFIRAAFTPYTPFWHNHKLQVLTGMMVVYFFVKNAIKNERNEENENNEEIEKIGNNEENESNERNEKIKKKGILSLFHSFISSLNINISSFLIFSFILSGFLQAIYGLLQLYGIYPSHHNLFKITGSFFNPAPYALYLAAVFPLALGEVIFNERNEENENNEKKSGKESHILSLFHSFILSFTYYLSFATVIAILLVLPATMIRASWLGAIAGSLVVLQYKYHYLQRIKHFLKSPFRRIMGMISAIVFFILIGSGIYLLKKDSANGKLFIWEVTLGKIAEKPLLGHGLGRYEAEYNNWQAEYFMSHPEEMEGHKGWVAGNTKYAFNEYLEMASEIGVIGLLLYLAVILSLLPVSYYLIPSFSHTLKAHSSITSSNNFLIPSLISLLATALISFPLYSVPTLVFVFILFGILASHKIPKAMIYLAGGITLKLFRIVQATALIGGCIWLSNYLNSQFKSYQIIDKAIMLYQIASPQESCLSFSEVYDNMKYDGTYLQYYASI